MPYPNAHKIQFIIQVWPFSPTPTLVAGAAFPFVVSSLTPPSFFPRLRGVFTPTPISHREKRENLHGGGFRTAATVWTLVVETLPLGWDRPRWRVDANFSTRGECSVGLHSHGTFMQRVTSRFVVWSIGRKWRVRDLVPESWTRSLFSWSHL